MRLTYPLNKFDRIALYLVGVLFVLSYYPTLVKLVQYWAANDMYSYGFVVPLISGLLVWVKRKELDGILTSPSLGLGTVVSTIGLLMLAVGRVSGTNLVEEISLVVTLCGLTLLLLGTHTFCVLVFPIAYLISMIPFWEHLTNRIHPYFQLYSASVGVGLVRLLGVPVLREGFIIALPNINLEVAQVCSGVNYLIAVLCLGIPMAYLFVKSWSKRVFIVLAATTIALLSNGLRVAIVSLFAYFEIRGANGDIHGPFALFRSLLISGVGFMAVFGLVFRLAERDAPFYSQWTGEENDRSRDGASFTLRPLSVLLAVIMLGGFIGFEVSHRVTAVPLNGDLRSFPGTIGRWESRGAGSFSSDLELLTFDEKLSRNYAGPDGTELNLFLGYFQSQEQGRELAGYAIRTILSDREHSGYAIPLGEPTRVNDFLTTIGTDRFHVTYWYVLNGRVVSNDYKTKLYTAWDSIVHGRSNGAIVVIKTEARRNESIEVERVRVREFLEGFMTVSKDYLPRL